MAWVDFRKTYDVQIIKTLKLIGATSYFIALFKSTMIDWKTEFISVEMNLGEVSIDRGIFQGDSF